EAYAEYNPGSNPENISVWVELYNTLNRNPSPSPDPDPLFNNGDVQLNGVYQLVLCKPGTGTHLRLPDNPRGDPYGVPSDNVSYVLPLTITPAADAVISDFSGAPVLGASTDFMNGVAGTPPKGFYVIGPGTFSGATGPANLSLNSPNMKYQ